LVEHWLFGLFWPVRDVSTACLVCWGGFREVIVGLAGGPGTLLGPEGTGTGFGVRCLQAFRLVPAGLVGAGRACGPFRPSYRAGRVLVVLVVGWRGVLGWAGGLVAVVGCARSCFENCIVNASIFCL
jgi:hypothetical protein